MSVLLIFPTIFQVSSNIMSSGLTVSTEVTEAIKAVRDMLEKGEHPKFQDGEGKTFKEFKNAGGRKETTVLVKYGIRVEGQNTTGGTKNLYFICLADEKCWNYEVFSTITTDLSQVGREEEMVLLEVSQICWRREVTKYIGNVLRVFSDCFTGFLEDAVLYSFCE